MRNKYWIEFSGSHDAKTRRVRYGTPSLGFTVDKEVDETTERLLQIAIEFGKQQKVDELRCLLQIHER